MIKIVHLLQAGILLIYIPFLSLNTINTDIGLGYSKIIAIHSLFISVV